MRIPGGTLTEPRGLHAAAARDGRAARWRRHTANAELYDPATNRGR
jgi:hypothetical protein